VSHHSATSSVSQRSKDRRQVIADKKNNKKMSALQDLKARREEKKKQGEEVLYLVCFVACSMKSYAVFQGVILDDLRYPSCMVFSYCHYSSFAADKVMVLKVYFCTNT